MKVLGLAFLVIGIPIGGLGLVAMVSTPFSHPEGDVPQSLGYLAGFSFVALGVGLCFVGIAFKRRGEGDSSGRVA